MTTTRRVFTAALFALTATVGGAVTTVVPAGGPPDSTKGGRPGRHATAGPVTAGQRETLPAQPPPPARPPALLARQDEDQPSRPLVLEQARYDVTVIGLSARTRATFVFRNDLDRVLEGELVFPLPEGAVVSGYGLDVNGRMVDGVVVEAQQARVAFETEIRRGVDPGLVEWVRGNNFRTRVWPIPARGRRTVSVEYLSDLATRRAGEGHEALYELPLRFAAPLEELALRIEVVRGEAAPTIRSGLANLTFDRWPDRYVAETTRRDVQPGDDLRVALPDVARAAVATETNERGETYFVVDDLPEVPAMAADRLPAPKRIAIVWDASLSRREADRERDLRLLAAHLERFGNVEADVIVFRDVPAPVRRFTLRQGNASALVADLRDQPYDGATNVAAVRFPEDVAYTLLFSDGLSTIGGGDARVPARPVYALSGDATADHARLRALAERSGGAYFNLQRHTDDDVLGRLGRPVFSLLGVDADATQVADLEPAGARAVTGGRVRVAGRLLAPEARLALRYGLPGQPASAVTTVIVKRQSAKTGGLVERLWAQQRLGTLAVDEEGNHEDMVRLGQRFSLVTPGTSLLVLETLEQYLSHDVTPPATLPELRSAYLERRREEGSRQAEKRAGKTERVVTMWEQRVEWWERRYSYDPGFRYVERQPAVPAARADGGASPAQRLRDEAQPVAAPPPPSPIPEAAEAVTVRAAAPTARTSRALAAPEAKEEADSSGPSIVIQPWNPDTPYLRSIVKAPAANAYRVYLAERDTYDGSPAFYLDCADVFFKNGQRDLGLRVLSNVAELKLEDARLLRVLAHRLEQVDELDLAVELFDRVRRLRPEEPQSNRDLALALDRRAGVRQRRDGRLTPASIDDYRRALELLAEVVQGEWDGRFPEIEVIALEEANRIAAIMERGGARQPWPLDARLHRLLDVDVRIVLTWDTDQTDMDLWVIEPSGEKCFFSHALTTIGGAISKDFTGGYGPEVYAARQALGGKYDVKANFYGSRSQSLTGPTTVQATVITNYGRPGESRQALTVRLSSSRDVVDVGSASFGEPGDSQ
jgi:Ca-activated chloride channel family protein